MMFVVTHKVTIIINMCSPFSKWICILLIIVNSTSFILESLRYSKIVYKLFMFNTVFEFNCCYYVTVFFHLAWKIFLYDTHIPLTLNELYKKTSYALIVLLGPHAYQMVLVILGT